MNLQGIDKPYAIYGVLFSLSNRIQTIGDKEFSDITMKQHFMMIALGMFETPPTLKEMGELIGCSYQNVKRMAKHLEQKGYLQILQDSNDKRKLLLLSTKRFEKMADLDTQKTISFMTSLYQNISDQDLSITLKTLVQMNQNIGGMIE